MTGKNQASYQFTRRTVLASAVGSSVFAASPLAALGEPAGSGGVEFTSPELWESLNPGYWRFDGTGMRRVVKALGDRARATGFPYHYETRGLGDATVSGEMPVVYDPSLPLGLMWRRDWRLQHEFSISTRGVVKSLTPDPNDGDDPTWAMYRSDYGLIGLCFGGKTQFESFHPSRGAAPLLVLREDGVVSLCRHTGSELAELGDGASAVLRPLQPGDRFALELVVRPHSETPEIVATARLNGEEPVKLRWSGSSQAWSADGFVGVAARGLLDVSLEKFDVVPGRNERQFVPLNSCCLAYALGDTLRRGKDGRWTVRMVALFRGSGETAAIRVSTEENPAEGWDSLPLAGQAPILSNDFRLHTALIDVALPEDPSRVTHYFTVWKDGVDVTGDPRLGTASVGPGTGLVGDVPAEGGYVGRLPRLMAPYRVLGLSCHAIHTARQANLEGAGAPGAIHAPFYVHDQPTKGAFSELERYGAQILLWEDDVWYLELLFYPSSLEDAYKVITTTIAGPTTRWKMMRHWNVINPGDHDYGMDDVKGPEQLLLRQRDDLGQDPDYMRRNFQIVAHLSRGIVDPDPAVNPKRWRAWTMPDSDLSILILDSRLWRTSQDTDIWDDSGWDHVENLYSRKDPTRTLLGEEQFAWLASQIRTNAAPHICVTGLNALHTIWGGWDRGWTDRVLERDRVSADYAGWVSAASTRVLDLLAERDGVVAVYGDVHAGSIIRNKKLRLYECSFGPIGRWGSRSLVADFGRDMRDDEGRELDCIALYHHQYETPELDRLSGPPYWNFLEMVFDPVSPGSTITLALRNIIDGPETVPRGGGSVRASARDMGRPPASRLPEHAVLADACITILGANGEPIRGLKSDGTGKLSSVGLVGVLPDETVTLVARRGGNVEAYTLRTLAP